MNCFTLALLLVGIPGAVTDEFIGSGKIHVQTNGNNIGCLDANGKFTTNMTSAPFQQNVGCAQFAAASDLFATYIGNLEIDSGALNTVNFNNAACPFLFVTSNPWYMYKSSSDGSNNFYTAVPASSSESDVTDVDVDSIYGSKEVQLYFDRLSG